jgi:hypothetical protein
MEIILLILLELILSRGALCDDYNDFDNSSEESSEGNSEIIGTTYPDDNGKYK